MLVEVAVASLLPLLSPSPVLILLFFSLSIVQEYILVYESVFTRGQTLRRRILADAWFMGRLVEIFGLGSGGVCVLSSLHCGYIFAAAVCTTFIRRRRHRSFLLRYGRKRGARPVVFVGRAASFRGAEGPAHLLYMAAECWILPLLWRDCSGSRARLVVSSSRRRVRLGATARPPSAAWSGFIVFFSYFTSAV